MVLMLVEIAGAGTSGQLYVLSVLQFDKLDRWSCILTILPLKKKVDEGISKQRW